MPLSSSVDPSSRKNLSSTQKPLLLFSFRNSFSSRSRSRSRSRSSSRGPEMGVFKVLWPSSLFFLVIIIIIIIISTFFPIVSSSMPPLNEIEQKLAPPPFIPQGKSNMAPFRPSIAVIVGVLTTMFSITFLLLLYAKHCKRGNGYVNGVRNSAGFITPATARKNSGIDRTVIQLLPIFRFGSLRGQKEGLECAVCLNRFEPTEVLRLLPKCKHAFHVECVDTWLDAHSTCPLCRYRVDPEDILLIEDAKILQENEPLPPAVAVATESENDKLGLRRMSGRHSSAGERGTGFLQIVLERPGESGLHDLRRSLDSSSPRKNSEPVSVGCFDRVRKDGLLLTEGLAADRRSFERRFEHRIIVSTGSGGFQQRWSDVQASDLLYLRSEMIISDSRRLSCASGSQPSVSSSSRGRQVHQMGASQWNSYRERRGIDGNCGSCGEQQSGRSVINARSVSEITGLSRTSNNHHQQQQERQAGLVSRWLAWISQSQSQPAVRSARTTALGS